MRLVVAAITLILGTIAGWIVGLQIYRLVAVSMYSHPVSPADIEAMGFWLALATAMALPFAHLPVVAWLSHRVSRASHRAIHAFIGGIALGPLPAALLAVIWSGGKFSAVFTPECGLAAVWAAFIGSGLMVPAIWFADAWSAQSSV